MSKIGMQNLEANREEIEAGLIQITEPCSGDETMTYVYSVKPELKASVVALLKESCNPVSLANTLCNHLILEAEDCYV